MEPRGPGGGRANGTQCRPSAELLAQFERLATRENNKGAGSDSRQLMARQKAEPGTSGPLAGAGQPRRQQEEVPVLRRVGSWLVWWTLLMALWVWVDDSIALAELLAGGAVAAVGALFADLVSYQTATRFRAASSGLRRLPPCLPAW